MNSLNMKKFSLFAVLIALVLAATCLFALPTEANAASTMTLTQLQEKFPSGKYWNHYVSSVSNCGDSLMSRGDESFADSVSSTPCASHSATSASYYVGKYDCNFFNGGIQCFGFARKLGYDAFGTKVSTWSIHSSIGNIKPGDVVRFWSPDTDPTYGHSVFVTAISGTTITVGEANIDGSPCKIRWGHQYNLSSAWKVEVYSAPATLDTNHEHNYTEYVYYWAVHPHYNCYKCSCGDIKEDRYEPVYLASCSLCNCSHSYDNACDTVCNACGTSRTITHNYSAATCTKAKTCKTCGTTRGSALGHSYSAATCTRPRTCRTCGVTSGSTLGHNYATATCTTAATCTVCGTTSGSSLGHSYTNACDTSCNSCGATRTIVHSYTAATCTKAKTCKICGVTSGSSLGHSYTNACDTSCNKCGATRTVTHSYAAATCTKAKTCKVCGTTSGKALGHSYTNACDTTCNRSGCSTKRTITHSYAAATCTKAKTCKICGATSGKKLGHNYKTTVTKATTKKNGKEVKVCDRCDKKKTTTIYKIKTVKLSTTDYTYNGKKKTPTVTVKDSKGNKLKEGTDYTVTYDSGRKKVGEYDVKVKFKGDYSGSKTLTFEINPKGTTVSKLTAKSKALTVKLNKQTTQTTGYQIQYSTDKDFDSAKKVTVSSNKTGTKTIKSLKKGKKYYVRVRTYKVVDGEKFYSSWSSAKSIKTK